ncbi:hypothetical protein PhCBS80983_g01702 [Powellomyces hirtus]|uniref:LisH domain-containing protein n=1 Tax=Powellomyces hirtus TaxID=109895 RepID=A0A507E914_9FUNG|nr:hypothetical protein PhCBS80983_g01702 [Powellomyces hirtus]
MAANNTQDLNLVAYSLISQFLRQQNLTATLECLGAEAPHIFADLEAHKSISDHKPLTAILEEHHLLTFQQQLGQLSVQKREDDELLRLGKGRMPTEPCQIMEGIHYANILSTAAATLPTNLFPDAEIASPTVSVIVTSSTDKTVKISQADNGRTLCVLDHQKAACLATDVYPADPAYMLTAGMDGAHHIVDIRTGQAVQSWKDHAKYVVRAKFAPWDEGSWVVTASYDRSVNFYQRTSEKGSEPRYEKKHSIMFRGAVESLCFLPPADPSAPNAVPTLVVGCRDDNCLHYIDVDPQRAYPSTPFNMNANGDDWISFTAMDLAPSPNGRYLACYTDSKAGRIIVFRARSCVQARNLWGVVADGFSQPRCCWDSSGRYLFATSDDRKVYVLDVSSGQTVAKLEGHTETIRSISFDKERQRLLSCSFDKTVRVWETTEGVEEAGVQR